MWLLKMRIFCRFHTIGIQLLFVLHTVQSFVLLTADVEDVKKLASKFVSEPLAEKIATFITNFAADISDSDTESDSSDQVSEENYKYNIARERKEEVIDNKGDLSPSSIEAGEPENEEEHIKKLKNHEKKSYDRILHENSPSDVNKESDDDPASGGRSDNKPKYEASDALPTKTAMSEPKDQPVKQYSYAVSSQRPSKNKEGTFKEHSRYIKTKRRPLNLEKTAESTSGYAEVMPAKNVRKGKRLKASIHQSRSHKMPAKEVGMSADIARNADSQIVDDDGMLRAFKELTTKKARTEFDQYDNVNYPKSEYLATSGPVALPKMPVSKRRHDKDNDKNKYWF